MKNRVNAYRGFTLLETLVVMTLLSVIMLALVTAMRAMANIGDRVDSRLTQIDEMRISHELFSKVMGRISYQKLDKPPPVGTTPYILVARPNEFVWLGVMPARYGAGGRYFFRLSVEPIGLKRALVLRFLPWRGVGEMPEWAGSESRSMISDLTDVAFQYGDDRSGSMQWTDSWDRLDSLPTHFSLSTSSPQIAWPPTVIAMRELVSGGGSMGGFTVGGRK